MSFHHILSSIHQNGQLLSQEMGTSATDLNDFNAQGPFDGDNNQSDQAWSLAQKLVTDCNQLVSILTPRRFQALKFACSGALPTAIGIAAHFRIADLIEDAGGKASVADLAVTAKTDERKLENLLRTLSCHNMFVQPEPGVYTNNRQSRVLLKSEGASEMIEFYALVLGRSFQGLLPLMTDPENMHTIDPQKGAFSKAYGVPMGISDWMMLPSNHDALSQFISGIPWLSKLSAAETVDGYEWNQWGPTARVCDMGCADGGIMSQLKARHPSLRITCQDLDAVLERTRQVMQQSHPDSLANGEIVIQNHDYFTPQPVLADAYWLRGVLHDYSDEDCAKILENLRPKLRENNRARVIINEIVQPNFIIKQDEAHLPASQAVTEKQAAFQELTTLMQLHTTAFMGGIERSYIEFEQLFANCGYRIDRFKQLKHFTAIMEIALIE